MCHRRYQNPFDFLSINPRNCIHMRVKNRVPSDSINVNFVKIRDVRNVNL